MSTRECHSVLYVDHDPDICEVVQATLCLISGLNVVTAGSGEEAIEQLSKARPDLVLMDAMMPGLDGAATFKRMRENNLIDDIPVIFLTAKVLPAEVDHFVHLGALGVIGKPFDPLTLGDQVMRLWKGYDGTRALSAVGEEVSQGDAQVDTLAKRFLSRTRNDIERLNELINCPVKGDAKVLQELERICHSLYGAGAMFGYPQLSIAAGAMERRVREIAGSSAMLSLVDCTAELATALKDAERATSTESCMFQERRRDR
jgi:two-component system OmpR family response regulator